MGYSPEQVNTLLEGMIQSSVSLKSQKTAFYFHLVSQGFFSSARNNRELDTEFKVMKLFINFILDKLSVKEKKENK